MKYTIAPLVFLGAVVSYGIINASFSAITPPLLLLFCVRIWQLTKATKKTQRKELIQFHFQSIFGLVVWGSMVMVTEYF